MVDEKIKFSEFDTISSFQDSDILPIARSGNNYRLTPVNMGEYVNLAYDIDGKQSTAPYSSYIISGFQGTTPTSSLSVTLPSGSAIVNNTITDGDTLALTMANNRIRDIWLTSDGTYVQEDTPSGSYTELPRYPSRLHLYRIQTENSIISGVFNVGNPAPTTLQKEGDRAQTISTFIDTFFIQDTGILTWTATTAYVAGDIYVTPIGKMYRVQIGGTSGGTAPTATVGNITDGSCTVNFYATDDYQGGFRWGKNNGIKWYFSNVGLLHVCHMKDKYGDFIYPKVKTYLQTMIDHVAFTRQNSAAYIRGSIMITAGFYWRCTVAGTTAGSTPFSSGYSVGSTVVDGGATWEAVYQRYSNHLWCWLDTEADMTDYRSPDSHDSYAATLFQLLDRYIDLTGDTAWLAGLSGVPGYSYQNCLDQIIAENLNDQIVSNLTRTFQDGISPVDGSAYAIRFMLDNCETYSGYIAARDFYTAVGDTIRAASADTNADSITTGINALYSTTYGFFLWEAGASAATIEGIANPQFYPYVIAQFYPEIHAVPIADDRILSARLWASNKYQNWWSENGIDSFPICQMAYLAAKSWRDIEKAYDRINLAERIHMGAEKATMYIAELGYYLRAKELLVQSYGVLKTEQNNISIEDPYGTLTTYKLSLLDQTQEYTRSHGFDATALTFDTTVAWDLEKNQVSILTLTGNATLAAPTNQKGGTVYILIVKQNGSGGHTLAFNSTYKFAGGSDPTISSGANAIDVISFVSDGTNMLNLDLKQNLS